MCPLKWVNCFPIGWTHVLMVSQKNAWQSGGMWNVMKLNNRLRFAMCFVTYQPNGRSLRTWGKKAVRPWSSGTSCTESDIRQRFHKLFWWVGFGGDDVLPNEIKRLIPQKFKIQFITALYFSIVGIYVSIVFQNPQEKLQIVWWYTFGWS